jgi:hypothetical protein
MKAFFIGIVLGSIVFTEISHARCTPGVAKCFTLPQAVPSAATPEEATRLFGNLTKFGTEEVLRNCRPGPNTNVNEMFGSLCGPGVVASRICNYTSTLDCSYSGKSFSMNVDGACKGGLHDCGTFDACMKDAGVTLKNGSFRAANDPVPKGGFNSAPKGGAQ